MKITTLNDRTALRHLRNELDSALSVLSATLGVKLEAGNVTYDRNGKTCNFKVNCSLINPDGTVETKEKIDFINLCRLYGLSKDHFGKPFVCGGKIYKICGLNRKARKRPILASRAGSAAVYSFPSGLVRTALGINN